MTISHGKHIRVVDTTLRDGAHSIRHQYSAENVRDIAKGLDEAGVEIIEISHGDGLGGSSITYGFEKCTDKEKLQAAASVVKKGKIAVLLLPGVGIKEDLVMAREEGATVARIATHVTEANISEQHIGLAKELRMEVLCFLMMAHMADIKTMVGQAKLMQSYGVDGIYVVDSSGTMQPGEVRARVGAMVAELNVQVGYHAHNNLGLGIGNSIAAIEAGATLIDGSLRGMGAGAGNAMTEALVAVLNKAGYHTGIDLFKLMDVGEQKVKPLMPGPQEISNAALTLGYAGVYSSFLLHSIKAAEKFNLDPRDILVELGKRGTVGGQEDWIVDVAAEMAAKR
jgi:4-hydroxy-2-oxovalerate/4-hydroxy-2-oxohexanoate aldolase